MDSELKNAIHAVAKSMRDIDTRNEVNQVDMISGAVLMQARILVKHGLASIRRSRGNDVLVISDDARPLFKELGWSLKYG
ncbi:MAG: hypothetical protein OEV43_00570 [Coriobacteriia bacterium]|nr:hypothetical protein [Coriobacteriia bacterium]